MNVQILNKEIYPEGDRSAIILLDGNQFPVHIEGGAFNVLLCNFDGFAVKEINEIDTDVDNISKEELEILKQLSIQPKDSED